MAPERVIALTAASRPHYTLKAFESIAMAAGAENYTVLYQIDSHGRRVNELMSLDDGSWPFQVLSRVGSYGSPEAAVLAALTHGFNHAEYVIHFEDDHVLTYDGLWFFEWCDQIYRDDPAIFAISSYTPGHEGADPYEVARRAWFVSIGPWATWVERFENLMKPAWNASPLQWDINLQRYGRGALDCVFPVLSRSNNIGVEGATHPEALENDPARYQARYMAEKITPGPFFEGDRHGPQGTHAEITGRQYG